MAKNATIAAFITSHFATQTADRHSGCRGIPNLRFFFNNASHTLKSKSRPDVNTIARRDPFPRRV